MRELTEKELLYFYGGVESSADKANDDNTNDTLNCTCDYDNYSVIDNINNAHLCCCHCKRPEK